MGDVCRSAVGVRRHPDGASNDSGIEPLGSLHLPHRLLITRDSAEAAEAVQETFLDVLRALPHYQVEGPAKFETRLYRVTVNRCRMRLSDAIATEVTVETADP